MEKPDVQDDTTAGQEAETVLQMAPGVTLALVRVPAGEFLMGTSDNDTEAYGHEKPEHRVHLGEYLIGKYPVTVAQFAAFVQASGYRTTAEKEGGGYAWTGGEFKGADWQHPGGSPRDLQAIAHHPVTQVSWDDSVAFCQWASQVSGRAVRLPNEAEWEKAARGTDGRVYPWGSQAPDRERCNFNFSVRDTTPVGWHSPDDDSPYGCADMAGNVWEWTGSLFKPYPYRPDDGREDISGLGRRVVRGGAWDETQRYVRCACRGRSLPSYRFSDRGFRVCVSPI